MKIHDVIANRVVIDESEYKPRPRQFFEVTCKLARPPSGREDLNFEVTVLNHLLNNRHELGIRNLYRLRAACADGLLRLDSGEMVLLEIKYALGWAKCCQARAEFERFIDECIHCKFRVDKPQNGVIVFHHFSRDWSVPRRGRECGWVYFYEEEQVLNKSLVKTDILQLSNQKLVSYSGLS